ncbi:hypothetical protein [Bacillus marasmi]|uniref:hypothetical protein n=1 Tax=Bacillus marasmi TaxID=1926279 RepID=UPI0011CAD9A5|nr:hypothetical protein [Bacillus marasmi]
MKVRIHRCNCRKIWAIQTRKVKQTANSVLLIDQWNTELKPDRRVNPKGFVTTKDCNSIVLNPANELLENYIKITKLVFNKEEVSFNFTNGRNLFFSEDGACYLLSKIT